MHYPIPIKEFQYADGFVSAYCADHSLHFLIGKCTVDVICQKMGLKGVRYNFVPSKGGRGWPGDVKLAHLSIDKITSLGWKNRYSSDQAVEISIDETLKTIT